MARALVVIAVMLVTSSAAAEDRGPPTSTADAILRSLGGIEVSLLTGGAQVGSRIDDGTQRLVASGRARQSGWRISTYGAPTTTGFRLSPNLGFLDQRVRISDFREAFPQSSGTEIGGTCSDPATGEAFDCDEPNTYALHMRSGYAGARGGLDIVGGRIGYEWYLSGEAIVNGVEYRHMVAEIGRYRASGGGFKFFQSVGVGASFGVRIPQIHAAMRISGEYMAYPGFDYAEPLEFKGPVTYNPDKDIYERPRVFVRGASLGVWSFVWAFAITY